MKVRLYSFLTLCIFFSMSAYACDEGRHQKRLDRLDESLQLTDSQLQSIRTIFETHHQAMKESRDRARESRDAMHAEIKTILTEQQITKFESLRKHK